MKRNLVVVSSTQVVVNQTTADQQDELVEAAVAGERRRLEAYLYGHSSLVAAVHEVEHTGGSVRSHGEFTRILRVTQKALVTVEGNDPADARYLADYQGGRLQSGSFGVIDYVEDELAAREHVGLVEEEPAITFAEALNEAADDLSREEVEYALGLDSDHLEYSYVVENGVERPRTQADLDKELARHERIVALLREAAIILADR